MLFFYLMSLNSELFANFEALACCYLQQWYRAFTLLVDFEILELLKKDLHNFFLSIVCHFEGCLNHFLNTCMCLMKTWNHKLSFPKRIIEKTFLLFLYKMQLENKIPKPIEKAKKVFQLFSFSSSLFILTELFYVSLVYQDFIAFKRFSTKIHQKYFLRNIREILG